jgi:hypothetical protein
MLTEAGDDPSKILNRIQRGLCGYISYLAACEMNSAFSEYALYEPILRILTALGYTAKCEVKCSRRSARGSGDYPRIDFVASKQSGERTIKLAVEVKWHRTSKKCDVAGDCEKLAEFLGANDDASAYICVFGRLSHIENLKFSGGSARMLQESGKLVKADLGKTRYACRIYRVTQRVR